MRNISHFILFYRITSDPFCSIKLQITTFDRLGCIFVQRFVVAKDVSGKERHFPDNLNIQPRLTEFRARFTRKTKLPIYFSYSCFATYFQPYDALLVQRISIRPVYTVRRVQSFAYIRYNSRIRVCGALACNSEGVRRV